MKKKIKSLIVQSILITLILGTSATLSEKYTFASETKAPEYPTGGVEQPIKTLDAVEIESETKTSGKRRAPKRAGAVEHGYYYSFLNDAEKAYYNAIVQTAKQYPGGHTEDDEDYSTAVEFDTTQDKSSIISSDERQAASNAFWEDFPEYYYIKHTGMVTFWSTTDNATTYTLKAYVENEDDYTEERINTESAAVDSAAESFLADIDTTKSQPVVELAIHDKLISELQYDYDALEANNTEIHAHDLYGALIDHNVVCDGYSKAFQYLCQKAELTCIRVLGSAGKPSSTGGHAWNLVQLDGDWYEVDPTWDDQEAEVYQHTYFNITTVQISDLDGNVHIRDTDSVFQYTPNAEGTKYTYSVVSEMKNKTEPEPSRQFTDVDQNEFFYEAVNWGAENSVVTGYNNEDGTASFKPNDSCTREQFVTFLWRAFGSPESSLKLSPFADVTDSTYYYKAVLWAYENNITTGYTGGGQAVFGTGDLVTRAQAVTFLWRAAGSPSASTSTNPFVDVSDPGSEYYGTAMLWGSENGIVTGYTDASGARFAPDDSCTRGQVVTFLYRYAQKFLNV